MPRFEHILVKDAVFGDVLRILKDVGVDEVVRLHRLGGEKGMTEEQAPEAIKPEMGEVGFIGIRKRVIKACGFKKNQVFWLPEFDKAGEIRLRTQLKTVIEGAVDVGTPDQLLAELVEVCPSVVLAEGTTEDAKKIAKVAHPWVAVALDALKKLVLEGTGGHNFPAFFKQNGVKFAPSGPVKFKCVWINKEGKEVGEATGLQHHLSREKHEVAAEECPRIYFHQTKRNEGQYIVILHCGPHPTEERQTLTAKVYEP